MRVTRLPVPTVLSALALGVALAAFVGPHAGSAEAEPPVTPKPAFDQKVVDHANFTMAARVTALEARIDELNTRLTKVEPINARLDRDVTALKTHVHSYAGGLPGFGIVNIATLKQMLNRMDPTDAKATIPLAAELRLPSRSPRTGAPIDPNTP
jgi:hypothetical protein